MEYFVCLHLIIPLILSFKAELIIVIDNAIILYILQHLFLNQNKN